MVPTADLRILAFRLTTQLALAWCFLLIAAPLANGQEVAERSEEAAVADSQRILQSIETADFERVGEAVDELLETHSADQVLLVVDIDNTLLAMNQDLGSDQWFNWQAGLLNSDPVSPDLVAGDFEGLLEVQGILFALSHMHPPQPELPTLVSAIQDKGVAAIVLTSRGPEFRDASERELKRAGYDFTHSSIAIKETRDRFMPFDPYHPDDLGLDHETADELATRLKPVTYQHGIFMTAGQHKGYMLQLLLARAVADQHDSSQRTFSAIVFVDDHGKHTERMHEAWSDTEVDLITVRYSREDGDVKNFEDSSKRHVVAGWNNLKRDMQSLLVQ